MEKSPEILIRDVRFVVDTEKCQLREYGHPENTIAFDELKDEGDYYTTLFDSTTKNLFKGFIPFGSMPENVHRIIIPEIILRQYNDLTSLDLIQLNKISKEDDWGIGIPTDKLKVKKKVKNSQRKGGLR